MNAQETNTSPAIDEVKSAQEANDVPTTDQAKDTKIKEDGPTVSEIKRKKKKLISGLKDMAIGKVARPSKKPSLTDKLNIIKDGIEACKERVEAGKMSYEDIRIHLETHANLKVSNGTLRTYCQKELGFKTKAEIKAEKAAQAKQLGRSAR